MVRLIEPLDITIAVDWDEPQIKQKYDMSHDI